MDFAIIRLQGHQEIVTAETRNLTVDRIMEENGKIIKPDVLLTSINDIVVIGQPLVTDFPIELEIVSQEKGEKIYVQKFHSKARYRRRTGFRAKQTVLKVVKFGNFDLTKKEVKKVEKIDKTSKTTKKTVSQRKPRKITSKVK